MSDGTDWSGETEHGRERFEEIEATSRALDEHFPSFDAEAMFTAMTAQEFQESGLLFVANRTLHLFGVALMVTREADGTIHENLRVVRTSDSLGLVYNEASENEARARLFDWLQGEMRDGRIGA